ERKRTYSGILFILPALLLVGVFIIWPLVQVVKLSFYEWNGVSAVKQFVGLGNYRKLPNLIGFWEMASGTIIYAAGVAALTISISFIVALALDRRSKIGINRNVLRVLWFFPSLLGLAVIGILWRIMYDYNTGIINTVLSSFGLDRINWLETYGVTRWAIIIASVWSQIGINVIIFLAGLQTISTDFYEAAAIDGAKPLQVLLKITIPMMAQSITVVVLTTTIIAFKMYELPLTVSGGLPGNHTRLLTQKIYDLGFVSSDFGRGSALSVVLILIITFISFLQHLYLRKREDIY
ncbi:MAG: sugar ABC transporter permease, partial [Clostridiales bacterium]|nr:sugar ABC transporter permease [Clostridiales bacterium]